MSSKCNRLLHSHDIPSFEDEPEGRILPVRVGEEAPADLWSAEDIRVVGDGDGGDGEVVVKMS